MVLYSIQPRWVYDQLARGERFEARPRQDPDSWLNDPEGWFKDGQRNPTLDAYEWLCQQMQARGLPRPAADVFPVWAYQQWAGTRLPKPDLRYSGMKNWSGSKERCVLMTLDVDPARVLLSDYDAWHAPLNYWYLGRPRESNAFERRCKALSLSPYRQKPLPDPQLHEELLRSWQRIFDIPAGPQLMGTRKRDQCVQATFWHLDPADVVEAVEFGAAQPRRKLARPARVVVPTQSLNTNQPRKAA